MSADPSSVRVTAVAGLEALVDEEARTITAVPRDADERTLATHWLTSDTWRDLDGGMQ